MNKQTEALKLALEALKQIDEAMPFPVAKLAQKVIREALAEPDFWKDYVPEPVGALGSSIKSESPLGCNGPTGPAQQQPVASVPIHPKTGPLWAMTTDKPDSERLPSYPLMALYTSPQPAQRKPLTDEKIGQAARDAHIAFCLNKHQTYEHALTRAIEAAHGIKEKNI